MPWARKKEKHMAPPISSESATSRKRSISAILSDTLAPPSTTTSGRSGASTMPVQRGHLALQQQAGGGGQQLGHARRCWRGRGGRRRRRRPRTGRPARPALRPAPGRSSVSPGSQRVFSSTSTPPGSSASALAWASSPTTSAACATGASSSSDRRAEAGASDVSGSRSLGRPRCEHRISRAPGVAQQLDGGQRAADPRVVGDLARVVQRHVEVHAHEHALAALQIEVADRLLAERKLGEPPPLSRRGAQPGEHALGEVHDAVGVAPLVVVPGQDLDHAALDDHGQLGVEDRRCRASCPRCRWRRSGPRCTGGCPSAARRPPALTASLISSTVVSREAW